MDEREALVQTNTEQLETKIASLQLGAENIKDRKEKYLEVFFFNKADFITFKIKNNRTCFFQLIEAT